MFLDNSAANFAFSMSCSLTLVPFLDMELYFNESHENIFYDFSGFTGLPQYLHMMEISHFSVNFQGCIPYTR